jgi:hypothetical protein
MIPNLEESPTDTVPAEKVLRKETEKGEAVGAQAAASASAQVPKEPEGPPVMEPTIEVEEGKESLERVGKVVKAERQKRRNKEDKGGETILPIMEPESSTTVRDRDGLESGWY